MDHLVTSLHLVSSRAPLNDSAVEEMGAVVVLQEVTGVGPRRSRGVPTKVLFFLETGNVFRWEILFYQGETIEVPATFYLETFSAFLFFFTFIQDPQLFLAGAKGKTHSQNHSLPLLKNMP